MLGCFVDSLKPTKEVNSVPIDNQAVNNELKSLVSHNLPEFQPDLCIMACSRTLMQDRVQWLNDPTNYNLSKGILAITTAKRTDFFNNPEMVTV